MEQIRKICQLFPRVHSVEEMIAFNNYLINIPDQDYQVICSDKIVTLRQRLYILNIIHLRPLVMTAQQGLFDSGFLIPNGLFKRNNIHRAKADLIFKKLLSNGYERSNILNDILDSITCLYNFTIQHLGGYHSGTSAYDIEQTLNHPEIKPLLEIESLKEDFTSGIHVVEQSIKERSKVIWSKLSDPVTKNFNHLLPCIIADSIRPQQALQTIFTGGPRTDVDDTMLPYPIFSSYKAGLTDICDAAIDSRSSHKNEHYIAQNLGTSQYNNRKEQLTACEIAKIYPGDCGTNLYVEFDIHNFNASRLYGKNIIVQDKIIQLTPENIKHFINSTVKLRSPTTCPHTDGTCQVCGGLITQVLNPNTNIGLNATTNVLGDIGQLMLSNKHISTTVAMLYSLPHQLNAYFRTIRNEIYVANPSVLDSILIGIPYIYVSRLRDLEHIEKIEPINEKYFTSIREMIIANANSEELLTTMLLMTDSGNNHTAPYFSSEFLRYLKNNPDAIIRVDEKNDPLFDIVWIKLSGFTTKEPIIKCNINNDSSVRFAKRLQNLLLTNIKKHTSIATALKEISNIAYEKLDTNIFHLEIILKAALIRNMIDKRVPVVTDPNNVRFGTIYQILPARSIGGQFAYERNEAYLKAFSSYIIPHKSNMFDSYMNFRD